MGFNQRTELYNDEEVCSEVRISDGVCYKYHRLLGYDAMYLCYQRTTLLEEPNILTVIAWEPALKMETAGFFKTLAHSNQMTWLPSYKTKIFIVFHIIIYFFKIYRFYSILSQKYTVKPRRPITAFTPAASHLHFQPVLK
jgi:hypothetical protein